MLILIFGDKKEKFGNIPTMLTLHKLKEGSGLEIFTKKTIN